MASCSLKERTYQKAYLDIDSLVTAQVGQLASAQLKVEKKAQISEEGSATTTLLDSTMWENELEIFRQLDAINKPTFREGYRVTESRDDRSNLTVRSYTATIPSRIPYVRLYYLGQLRNLKKVEARVEDRNTLFFSLHDLTLHFEELNGQPQLTTYRVSGFQKMMLADTVKFHIEARVVR